MGPSMKNSAKQGKKGGIIAKKDDEEQKNGAYKKF